MTLFHAEQAWLGDRVATGVLIEEGAGVITRVSQGSTTIPAGARRLAGLTLPAFANAHSHAFHRALRGGPHQAAPDFWSWRDSMYRVAAALDPDRYRTLATAVYAEMALAGIGTVAEFHYLHHNPSGRPYDQPGAMGDAIAAAAGAAGVRLTLLDTLYLHGGLDGRTLEGAQVRFGDADWEAWARRIESVPPRPGVRVGAALHSVRAVGRTDIAAAAGWAQGRHLMLHVHASEQPAENADCLAATGMTPCQLLEHAGALGPETTVIHGTHLSHPDRALLARSGTGVCVCPTTERDLGDGICDARALFDMGIPLSLGTDSQAQIDMFEEARALELDQRLVTGARGLHTAAGLIAAATAGGMRAAGWEGGRLAPGQPCDLTTVGLDSVRTAGLGEPLTTAVFAASAADVTDLVVGGREVVREGRHLLVESPARLLREALAGL